MAKQFKKNAFYQGQVTDLTSQGQGVIKIDQYPFFVEGVIPGETISFKATKVNKKYGFGRLMEIMDASPDRVELTDPLGRQNGTMTLQHMSYPAQLAYKQKLVADTFYKLGGFNGLDVRQTMGMDHPWGYRNKAQIPVREVNGELTTGFYRRGTHDLIPIENYHIQDPVIDEIILTVRDILRQEHYQPYDEASNRGDIRHIIVKRGHYTHEVMVILVSNHRQLPRQDRVVSQIVERVPGLVSLILNHQPNKTNVILGPDNHVLWGRDYYEDQMMGLTLRISAHSFYQVNTPQAEKLYQQAIDAAGLTGQETVLDAYCGIGSISLALARHAGQVYAMEIVPEAVEMAWQNAGANNIHNVHFEAGSAEEWLPQWAQEGIRFDVAVVDPPRKGLDEGFITSLVDLSPDRIVYVSCNPATCARDCRLICDQGGYEIEWIQPVDLFPQTVHVEACVSLRKRAEGDD